MEYLIHESNIEKLNAKLAKIEKKCKKYNCPFIYEELGEEFKEFGWAQYIDHSLPYERAREIAKSRHSIEEVFSHTGKSLGFRNVPEHDIRRFVKVNVEGIAVINNWKPIAILEHVDSENNVVKLIDTNEQVPQIYYSRQICDHCDSHRARKDTILLKNTNTNEYKQVGRSCLKDFIGIDAESYAKLLSLFDDLAVFESIPEGSHQTKYFKLEEVLNNAFELIKRFGYQPTKTYIKGDDGEYFGQIDNPNSTKNIVARILLGTLERDEVEKLNNAQFDEHADHSQEINDLFVWVKSLDDEGAYNHNLKSLFTDSQTYVSIEHLGFVVSSIQAQKKDIELKEKERLKAENNAKLEYTGNVGDRIDVVGECAFITSIDTQFGQSRLYKIVSNNNIFVWWTSNLINEGKVHLKATVKDHKEYDGEKQTVITRCRIVND